jgi:c(7)-type cytochrome triheme protein
MTRTLIRTAALAALLVAGAALANDLPRLPAPVQLPAGVESPGLVKFDHATHVDSAKPRCLGCHATEFGILGRSAEQKAKPVTHARMEKGEACGACHGKTAFDFQDCTMCHAQ